MSPIYLIQLAFIILAYQMAKKRGRDTTLAIVGGLLFGVFACLYYLAAGDSESKRLEKVFALREPKEESK